MFRRSTVTIFSCLCWKSVRIFQAHLHKYEYSTRSSIPELTPCFRPLPASELVVRAKPSFHASHPNQWPYLLMIHTNYLWRWAARINHDRQWSRRIVCVHSPESAKHNYRLFTTSHRSYRFIVQNRKKRKEKRTTIAYRTTRTIKQLFYLESAPIIAAELWHGIEAASCLKCSFAVVSIPSHTHADCMENHISRIPYFLLKSIQRPCRDAQHTKISSQNQWAWIHICLPLPNRNLIRAQLAVDALALANVCIHPSIKCCASPASQPVSQFWSLAKQNQIKQILKRFCICYLLLLLLLLFGFPFADARNVGPNPIAIQRAAGPSRSIVRVMHAHYPQSMADYGSELVSQIYMAYSFMKCNLICVVRNGAVRASAALSMHFLRQLQAQRSR